MSPKGELAFKNVSSCKRSLFTGTYSHLVILKGIVAIIVNVPLKISKSSSD
jgi:hypothetical protein